MYLPDIELHTAATVEEATALMERYAPDARLLAGGTDLLVDLKTGRVKVGHVVSINRIEALRGVSAGDVGLRIGGLTTITQLARSPLVRERFAPLLDATRDMAAEQIRNVATVGGNIACAVPCADLPPVLTVLNASLVLASPRGERDAALGSFFVGPRQTVLAGDEVLKAVVVPNLPDGFGAAYARFALRDGNAIAVAAVAAALRLGDAGDIEDARIVLGAVAPIPKPAEAAAALLRGRPPGEDVFAEAAELAMQAAEPISDVRGSAEFRRELVGVLTRRALRAALGRARDAARAGREALGSEYER